MNQERLKAAALLFQTLEQRGISDVLHPHTGDRLIAWGEQLKDLPEGVKALDLRSYLVFHPGFAAAGLSTPWASSELALGITHLARFFDITECEAFFTFGPLQTPAFAHAIERIQAILEHASEQAQERLSVRQHTELMHGCLDDLLSRVGPARGLKNA